MKAVELINRAYVLSGIVARDLEQVQGSEGRDGIFWLNQLLAEKSMTGDHLPYYGHLNFTGVLGDQEYFVEDLVTADVITFNMGQIRYSLKPSPRKEYWGDSRADDINSLPYHYYAERVNGGMNIFFYFKPAGAYIFKVTGLVSLSQVTNDTQLDDALDKFYQSFLIFELAERLCQWKQISLPPSAQNQLDVFRRKLIDLNQMDFTLRQKSLMATSPVLTYAQVNMGKGWTRP